MSKVVADGWKVTMPSTPATLWGAAVLTVHSRCQRRSPCGVSCLVRSAFPLRVVLPDSHVHAHRDAHA